MNPVVHVLDLQFQTRGTVAAFVIETNAGPVLIETGPHSTFPALEAGLSDLGYRPSDVAQVLLSHIHFDHAGAAWAMARAGATIHLHPVGVRHLQDPSRLYNSARRIYGEMMEPLWGRMEPIPAEQLSATADNTVIEVGGVRFTALHTPGHAKHHIAWQTGDLLFSGDVAGCKIDDGPVSPPCPPPDIDLEAWIASIDRIAALPLRRMYLTHFGPVDQIQAHLAELRQRLQAWGDWIKPHWERGTSAEEITPGFQAFAAEELADAGLGDFAIRQYEAANPAWMSVAGLLRYWSKRAES